MPNVINLKRESVHLTQHLRFHNVLMNPVPLRWEACCLFRSDLCRRQIQCCLSQAEDAGADPASEAALVRHTQN